MSDQSTNHARFPQAKALVQRIKNDKRVNFKYDWKMVTISIGGNDICSFICLMEEPESLPEKHRVALTKTLRYLKNNLPRLVSCF
jgi:GDSL-like Lipase/Acylhydrolase